MDLRLRIALRKLLDTGESLDIVADLPVIRYTGKISQVRIIPLYLGIILFLVLLPEEFYDLLAGQGLDITNPFLFGNASQLVDRKRFDVD